jgi:xylulokinase
MENKNFFLGIDIGTYSTKGVIIDNNGKVIFSHQVSHTLDNPKPNYFEHDAEKIWWNDFCIISKNLLNRNEIIKRNLKGVGISTLGADCLPVDKDCVPLRKAILYGIDARCQKEIEEITSILGEKNIYETLGRPLCSGDVIAKILWIKKNEPSIYEKTYKFLTGSSYIVAKLTKNFVIDSFLASASFRPLYDLKGNINFDICSLFCSPDQLVNSQTVTSIAGYINEEVEKETSIPKGVPVITGTGDSAAEAISVGVLEPGDMMIQFGSSIFIYLCTEKLTYDSRVRGNTFVIPNTFSVAAGTNNCGTLQKWYKDEIFNISPNEKNPYSVLMVDIEKIQPGSENLITLPYFAGERTPINNPNAKGVIFGLTLNHTKKHLYRSMLESIGYSIKQHIDIFSEKNIKLNRIIAAGGGTNNLIWMQIISDIINEKLYIPEENIGASYGDALMAGIGVGEFKNFSSLKEFIKIKKVLYPNSENHKKYKKYQKIYNTLYSVTKNVMDELK